MKKVYWDGIELKPGQIGRLFILKDTSLFSLKGDKQVFSRTLKANEKYRIYSFKPGMLDVGGGYYVSRDSKVRYETPSKAKLQAKECVYGTGPQNLKEVKLLQQEVDQLETALKNNEPQSKIEDRSKSIQMKLDVLKYGDSNSITPIIQQLKKLKEGYVTLAEWKTPRNFSTNDMVIDDTKGILYTAGNDELNVFTTKDLSHLEKIDVKGIKSIQLYKGKLYMGGQTMKVYDPVSRTIETVDSRFNDVIDFVVHKDHIYYSINPYLNSPQLNKSEVKDYDLTKKTLTTITKQENPEDYRLTSFIKLSVDPVKDILYMSSDQIRAVDLKTYNILSKDNIREQNNGGYWTTWAPGGNIWEGGDLFVSDNKINPTNLNQILGGYSGSFHSVREVKGKYVFGKKFVFDRENFVPYRQMPSNYSNLTVDSSLHVYGYDSMYGVLTKRKLNIVPIHLPTFNNGNKQIVFEKEISDWEYDEKTNKIYAISWTEDKLFYINATTMMVEKEVLIGNSPWELVVYDGSIYISLSGSNRIAVASTSPSKPVSYINVNTFPTDLEVGKNHIYYRGSQYDVYAYNKLSGQIVSIKENDGSSYYEPNLKLDSSGKILYIDHHSGVQIHAIDAEAFQKIDQSDRHPQLGDSEMLLDDSYLYRRIFRFSKNDLKNVQEITDQPILYVGKEYLITRDAYYDKATLIKKKQFTNNIYSARMNTRNEVFVLDEDKKVLKKYNNINAIE